MKIFCLLIITCLLYACDTQDIEMQTSNGYKPVYASSLNLGEIAFEGPRQTTRPGKIYSFGNYIFQNEINEGIHVIDNTVPAHAAKVAFMKIPYNTEMAIKDHYLYANRLDQLLVFDIRNPSAPLLVKELENIFPLPNQTYPPFQGVTFECADPSKGLIIDWELASGNFKCRR